MTLALPALQREPFQRARHPEALDALHKGDQTTLLDELTERQQC